MSEFYEKFKVRHNEVDMFNQLKIRDCFNYLQESAANHAKQLGLGFDAMSKAQLIWVLAKIRIKFFRNPCMGECLEVKTYPTKIEKFYFHREFEILDSQQNIVAQSSSCWLALDEEKLRPIKEQSMPVKMELSPDLPTFFNFQKVEIPKDLEELMTYNVNYSGIDINCHLNNAEYAGLVQDTLYRKLQTKFVITELEIAFISARVYSEKIILKAKIEENKFFVKGETEDGKSVFTALGALSYE